MNEKTQEMIDRAKRDYDWDVEATFKLRINRAGESQVLHVSASELEARLNDADVARVRAATRDFDRADTLVRRFITQLTYEHGEGLRLAITTAEELSKLPREVLEGHPGFQRIVQIFKILDAGKGKELEAAIKPGEGESFLATYA